MDTLEAPALSRLQGATTKADRDPQYVEEEQRGSRPAMAPPLRRRLGGGALVPRAVVARRSCTTPGTHRSSRLGPRHEGPANVFIHFPIIGGSVPPHLCLAPLTYHLA